MEVTLKHVGGTCRSGEPEYIGPWTFQSDIVRHIVEDRLSGRVLNACAGKTELGHTDEVVRNDINPDRKADYHHDVCAIDEVFPTNSFDTIVFDPPFDQTQADEHYESMHARDEAQARDCFQNTIRPGGKVLEFGWNMYGMADGFKSWDRLEVFVFRRGPNLQPVFLIVDEYNQERLL